MNVIERLDAEIAADDENDRRQRESDADALQRDALQRDASVIAQCRRAVIDALGKDEGGEVLDAARLTVDTYGEYGMRIEIAGLKTVKVFAAGRARVKRGDGWSIDTHTIEDTLKTARRLWLEEDEKAEHRRRRLEDWSADYESYCAELAEAWRHNSRILGEIAADFAARPFTARRLTYGIVFGDGADPTTESAWICDLAGQTAAEILPNGRTEIATFWHIAKTGPARTWTPAEADASTDPAPPFRQAMIRDWRIIAPPGDRPLSSEIEEEIASHGETLLRYPNRADCPADIDGQALWSAAEKIEREIFTESEATDPALADRLIAAALNIPF